MPETTLQTAAAEVVSTYSPPGPGPLRSVLFAIARHFLTALGATLVARGLVDTKTADAAIGALAQEVVGLVLILGGTVGAALKAELSHSRWADAWAVLTGAATATPTPSERTDA